LSNTSAKMDGIKTSRIAYFSLKIEGRKIKVATEIMRCHHSWDCNYCISLWWTQNKPEFISVNIWQPFFGYMQNSFSSPMSFMISICLSVDV